MLTEKSKDSIREKNRINMKNLWKNPEYRKHMSEIHKGKKQSKETIEKRRMKRIGIPLSEKAKYNQSQAKIGILNPMFGKNLSIEHKRKISKSLKGKYVGEKGSQWNGGKTVSGFGYILIHSPSHPSCNYHGYVREHRLVMEKHLGRYLTREEVVHHINDIKTDNRIENLQLCANESEHQKCHHPEGDIFGKNKIIHI